MFFQNFRGVFFQRLLGSSEVGGWSGAMNVMSNLADDGKRTDKNKKKRKDNNRKQRRELLSITSQRKQIQDCTTILLSVAGSSGGWIVRGLRV